MAPQPAPGTGAPPTGNALTDAQAADVAAASQQAVNALIGIGQTVAQPQGSECLWPPPATWGLGFGPVRFSLGVPCFFTKSEARALFGAGLVIVGGLTMFGGVQIIATAGLLGIALRVAGVKSGGRAARGAAPAAETASAPAASEVALAA